MMSLSIKETGNKIYPFCLTLNAEKLFKTKKEAQEYMAKLMGWDE